MMSRMLFSPLSGAFSRFDTVIHDHIKGLRSANSNSVGLKSCTPCRVKPPKCDISYGQLNYADPNWAVAQTHQL